MRGTPVAVPGEDGAGAVSCAEGQGAPEQTRGRVWIWPSIPTTSSWLLLSAPSQCRKHPGCVQAASKTRCKQENYIVRQGISAETDDFS